MKDQSYLAFDLGAESGRALMGRIHDDRLHLEEIHRFPNGPIEIEGSLRWDTGRIWSQIREGLAAAGRLGDTRLAGIGLDTWGVDFGLLDAEDNLIEEPCHYRDSRTDGMMDEAFRLIPRNRIFEYTGIQFMQLNSIYQLLAMARADSPALASATTFLNMPDLFNFWLSGRKVNEFTIATTTQCYDPRVGDWAREMIEVLGIPSHIFGEIVQPGTVLDRLKESLVEETGCPEVPVIAPACHDTGSAVAAIPAEGDDFIYLSSGTWSLMGVEVDEPVINDRSLLYNFTNEGGAGGRFRLLRNIMGLWLVQECRRQWAQNGEELSYEALTDMAREAPASGPLIDPGDSRFLPPGDMPSRITEFCRETGQIVPRTKGEIIRCALESLSLEYRRVAERLVELTGRELPIIHIIGGGSRNRFLNQLTADTTGRRVLTGPVEATAMGNVLIQALALGHIPSLARGRAIVRRSVELEEFEPEGTEDRDVAFRRYMALRNDL